MESRSLYNSLETRYGLAKKLGGVKDLQTRKKSANGFENLLLQGITSHSETLLMLLHNQLVSL